MELLKSKSSCGRTLILFRIYVPPSGIRVLIWQQSTGHFLFTMSEQHNVNNIVDKHDVLGTAEVTGRE